MIGHRRHQAERVDPPGQVALHVIGFARIERIAIDLEARVIVALDHRLYEIGHRMVAQIG